MFSKPENGISVVTINNVVIGEAGYVEENIANDILDDLIEYIKGETDYFELYLTNEDYDFGICRVMFEWYAYSNQSGKMELLCKLESDNDDSVRGNISKLAREIYNDFTRDFETWVSVAAESNSYDDIMITGKELDKKLKELDRLLKLNDITKDRVDYF